MRIDIVTIFPRFFRSFLTHGMVRRARELGRLEVQVTDLRALTSDRHHAVDDRPYGGGPGMLLKPEPVCRALDILGIPEGEEPPEGTALLLPCPRGERLEQAHFEEFVELDRLVFLCGRYEGYDERILEAYPWHHVSVGDYVLSGGEVPVMTMIEGVSRLVPGVLGDFESARRDSFGEWAGRVAEGETSPAESSSADDGMVADGLDHASWTRPPQYRGRPVPEILKSGDHGKIETWRRERAREATARRRAKQTERPDRQR